MKNRILGLATLALAFAATLPAKMVRPQQPSGPYGTSGRTQSFRHRDTKKHVSREDRNRAYKMQRAANRERRRLLQERGYA